MSLARNGVHVVQWAAPERPGQRPPEVLSPVARSMLARLGFREPAEGVAPCEGVLSMWGGREPDYHDYRFSAVMPGLAVRRDALLGALEALARGCGVEVRAERWRDPRREAAAMPDAWARKACSEGDAYVLLAGGRGTGRRGRARLDATVALCAPFRFRRHAARLVVEASREGWWYAVPLGGGDGSLCFLTDADLLPSGPDRRLWLERLFRETRLLREAAGEIPDFSRTVGVDAHCGTGGALVWDGGARIGEAALSLDPLSGTGVVRAIEGGLVAAAELLGAGRAGERYSLFMAELAGRERELRRAAFARAACRSPGAPFWRRRTDLGAP